jgi:hypothetical protein
MARNEAVALADISSFPGNFFKSGALIGSCGDVKMFLFGWVLWVWEVLLLVCSCLLISLFKFVWLSYCLIICLIVLLFLSVYFYLLVRPLVCPFVLSICSSICSTNCFPICLFIFYLFVHSVFSSLVYLSFTYLSTCLSIWLIVSLKVCFVFGCLLVCPPVYFTCLSWCLFVYLSVYFSVNL